MVRVRVRVTSCVNSGPNISLNRGSEDVHEYKWWHLLLIVAIVVVVVVTVVVVAVTKGNNNMFVSTCRWMRVCLSWLRWDLEFTWWLSSTWQSMEYKLIMKPSGVL